MEEAPKQSKAHYQYIRKIDQNGNYSDVIPVEAKESKKSLKRVRSLKSTKGVTDHGN
jgi:hypothetical protein